MGKGSPSRLKMGASTHPNRHKGDHIEQSLEESRRRLERPRCLALRAANIACPRIHKMPKNNEAHQGLDNQVTQLQRVVGEVLVLLDGVRIRGDSRDCTCGVTGSCILCGPLTLRGYPPRCVISCDISCAERWLDTPATRDLGDNRAER